MGILLAASVLVLSPFMGADHPRTPIHFVGWPKGVEALVNGKERVHGYFVNWSDVFFFNGDADRFNAFLASYAKVPGVKHRLILHTGNLAVSSPWDKKPRDIEGNWRMVTISLTKSATVSVSEKSVVLDLWLDGRIPKKRIAVPKNVAIEYAKSKG